MAVVGKYDYGDDAWLKNWDVSYHSTWRYRGVTMAQGDFAASRGDRVQIRGEVPGRDAANSWYEVIVQNRVNPEKRQPVSTSDSEGTRWLVEERVTELESWLSQQCDASGMQDNVVNPLSAPGWQDREMIEQCASPWGPEFRCRTCYSQDGCAAH